MSTTRLYRFTMTVEVEPDQDGYDDPGGSPMRPGAPSRKQYGYECTFSDIVELPGPEPPGASEVAES